MGIGLDLQDAARRAAQLGQSTTPPQEGRTRDQLVADLNEARKSALMMFTEILNDGQPTHPDDVLGHLRTFPKRLDALLLAQTRVAQWDTRKAVLEDVWQAWQSPRDEDGAKFDQWLRSQLEVSP